MPYLEERRIIPAAMFLFKILHKYFELMSKEHRTHAATERVNDLLCYQCDTMEDGEKCADLSENNTTLVQKCANDKRICMVKRFSYTRSNENSTSVPMMWALQRNCTNKCEPGCIIIGERTKLYACIACCETSLCNTGKGTATDTKSTEVGFLLAFILQLVLTVAMYPS
ncbi:uncharacterized protein LOC122500048 isoform X2 [Leptopilina heterotoma]|uniref:uncharacterized protein LOC122500048 isoform X2 n=1 Tax=Leptopilina heterotoma TaxID=63436 RepID=UPI001CA7F621|nr:uncharacterized protein LOC122500048 isoform X2 [Leptopilina heterotoma]